MTTRTVPAPRPSGGALADPAVAAAARTNANRRRAEYLTSVATGLLNVHDVITAACAPDGSALLRISLTQLLGAQPEWGKTRVSAAVTRLRVLLGEPRTDRRLTVAWLVDPRTRGARVLAFTDALNDGDIGPPWRGFPFAPQTSPTQTGLTR
ncbi:hypothetical protein CHO01_28960 [Cellulomonas hominis]|uniref:Uncharacterized protein n=1 Tax=Cellulomonas hominis TaxID=156981 RepID=A0A511FEV0_9CELL|nr:hypothetical protein [Cellulomonas hominis]MBB5474754.1 hypothetical protein [Cellulomonas hominis]NKY05410.1 hypothetical protein [Cellulomonas hominis]GEL47780.1 hypothetical protein CHO01_28960 [Cellulomonas hominis]